ncbi:unnamed protein product [Caenorhabditis bovis]|uniref:Globin domain-containing protein n=1 Tax=Caenorhabditis bovis TaxID=2654633 RepID=A0A8S1E7K1_9PELO|nr:unnamed protein product [Caenorhabditis bovis]
MGNDQSNQNVDMRTRRSLDASMFNKTKSATPRPSVAHASPSPNHHRRSADFQGASPRRSLCEQMGNNVPSRRMSRATIHLENSTSENASFVDSLHLSPHQVHLLVSTWPRIKSTNGIFVQVFKLLMTRSTVARDMFQKMSIVGGFAANQKICDLNSHAKLLSELLDNLMADLQQPAKIVQAKCQDVGAAHVSMNEKCCGTVFDQLGECFTEIITKVECVRSKREAMKSWICLVSYIVDNIKSGYMEEWSKMKRSGMQTVPKTEASILCVYGAVKKFRPATPFLTPFLTSSQKNLTLEEVYSEIYPYWTYSYLVALIPMFILTDILRYKPIILIEALSLVATWCLLVFGTGVLQMQFMQALFGISSAAEIAYLSYIYSIVDSKHYPKVSSYVRCAVLLGKLAAFALGQLLVSTKMCDYLMLNKTKYNCRLLDDEFGGKIDVFGKTFAQLKNCAKNRNLLLWSLWWALASCGTFQVQNYIQSLWKDIQKDSTYEVNGIVEFAQTFIGAILTFGTQYSSINWVKNAPYIMPTTSFLIAILLYISSKTLNILVAYISYIVINSIYHMLITAASANIAAEITTNSRALVFGCCTFVAVFMQTILTLVVVDSHFLHFNIRAQFFIYSCYFAGIAVFFLVFTIYLICSELNK